MSSRQTAVNAPTLVLAVVVSVCVVAWMPTQVAASALVAAPSLAGHRLLVERPGLRVYGPARRAGVPCPRLLPVPAHALATVKRAVELAMPPFEKQLRLDGRDPIVRV